MRMVMRHVAGGGVLVIATFIVISLAAARPASGAGVALAHVDSAQILYSQPAGSICSSRLTTMMGLLLFLERQERDARSSRLLGRLTVPAQMEGLESRPLHLTGGESLSAAELVKAILLTSAPEATRILIAKAFSSPLAAATEFNRRASSLGLSGTTAFRSVAERAAGSSPLLKSCSSVEDAALLAGALLRREEVARWLDLTGIPFRDGRVILRRENPLIASGVEQPATGCADTNCLVILTARQKGLRLVSAAIGAGAWPAAQESLERGLAEFELATIVRAGEPVGSVEVEGGTVDRLAAVARDSVCAPIRRGRRAAISVAAQLPARVKAPVAADQVLGELLVEQRGKLWAVVPLVSSLPVAPASWLNLAQREPVDITEEQGASRSMTSGRGLFSPKR